ncbi:ABC transporter permease [Paenibacillus albidus]|uniref:nickel transporter permease n=1 Tax=Paenibacillus albidus TaxID=2041023 RepID=UPI001BE5234D|nr:ABC transporter permease [Paenibacillus albidus]
MRSIIAAGQSSERHLFKKKAVWPAGLFLLVLVIVMISPALAPQDPYRLIVSDRLQPPGAGHFLGTDHLGRDLFSRMIAGIRATIGTSLLILSFSMLIGVTIGLLSGYLGGLYDRVFKRMIDAFMTLPDYIFAIVLSGLLGPGLINLLFAVIAVKWVGYARLVRSVVLQEKEKDYVALAILGGVTPLRIVMKHMLPHTLGNVFVLAALDLGKIILMIASLSYIGLGPQPPAAEWGSMLNEGRVYFNTAPHLMLAPGLAIMITVLLANLLGDKLRDQFDVKTRKEA